jgi:hypothetical protein
MSDLALMKESITRYVENGVPTGSFLEAVLSNDLFGAFSQADETSRTHLQELVRHIYWNVPSGCHGSPQKVTAWIRHRGLEGLKLKAGGDE